MAPGMCARALLAFNHIAIRDSLTLMINGFRPPPRALPSLRLLRS